MGREEAAAPRPERPDETAEIERHGTLIQVALVAKAWLLPVEALVLPAAVSGNEVGGGFYDALLQDLDAPVADRLFKLLLDRFPSALEPGSPVAVRLPDELANAILPFSPSGEAILIITTLRNADGTLDIHNVDRLMNGLVRLAADENLKSLAMPLIGTGPSQADRESSSVDDEKLDKVRVARVMSEALLARANLGGIQSLVIATIESAVVDAARRKFHAFSNNLAQALANDEPARIDLLGIAPEVKALAEALMLREVQAPLAVGVIGGWGSGKSTVMRLMWNHVADLRTLPVEKGWSDEQGAGAESAFVGHVYQISFNAWTYAKSNLWASLMHEIFIQLNQQLSLEQILATKLDLLKGGKLFSHLFNPHTALDRFVEQIDESLLQIDENLLWDKLRERKNEALKDVKETETQIAGLRVRRDLAALDQQQAVMKSLGEKEPQIAVGVLKARIRGFLDQAQSNTVTEILESEHVNEEQVQKLFKELRGIRTTALLLWQQARKNIWGSIGFALFCLLVIVGTFVLTQWNNWSALPAAFVRLAAFIPLLVPPLRVANDVSRWLDQQMENYNRLDAIEREQWQGQWEEHVNQICLQHKQEMEQKLAAVGPDRQAQLKALGDMAESGNLAAFDRQLALLEDQLKEQQKRVGPTADYVSLVEFVDARLNEAFYERRLGLMHEVQRGHG